MRARVFLCVSVANSFCPTSVPAAVPAAAPGSGFTVYFIDVGQGDATLVVASTGETLLIDGGRSKDRIRDRLERLGIENLDATGYADARMPGPLAAVDELGCL